MTRSSVNGFIVQFIRAAHVSEMERSWVRILINYKAALNFFFGFTYSMPYIAREADSVHDDSLI